MTTAPSSFQYGKSRAAGCLPLPRGACAGRQRRRREGCSAGIRHIATWLDKFISLAEADGDRETSSVYLGTYTILSITELSLRRRIPWRPGSVLRT